MAGTDLPRIRAMDMMIFMNKFNEDEVEEIYTHDRRRCDVIRDKIRGSLTSYQSKSGDWEPMKTGHISVDNRAFASHGPSNPKTHYRSLMASRRAALFARQTPIFLPYRNASTSVRVNGGDHHRDDYPKEGFGGPLWGYAILCSILAIGGYKYAPEPAGDVYLTRWIAMYTPPRSLWLDLNAKHAALQQKISEENLLLSDAKKGNVHRYRYPQSFEKASPFLTPIGMDVNTTRFVVKSDKD